MNNNRGPEITDSMTGFRTREIELLVNGATKNSIVVANRLWGEGKRGGRGETRNFVSN